MKKTPSYLKGLAETRARLAGDIERYERVSNEIAEKLVLARRELEACDLLIRRFDGRLDPNKIPVSLGGGTIRESADNSAARLSRSYGRAHRTLLRRWRCPGSCNCDLA
jgi:hypothetical protein